MIRRTTRPLTETERADLERPIISMPGRLWPHVVICLVGLVPGGVFAYLGGCAFEHIDTYSPGGRVIIGLLAIAVVLVGLLFAGLGLWFLYAGFPRKPRVVRPARDLRAASADVLEINAERGWLIDTSDEDVGSYLLLDLGEERYLLLDCPEVGDIRRPGSDDIGSQISIARFDRHCIDARAQGSPLPVAEISAVALTGNPWIIDELDVPLETELKADQLTLALQKLVARGLKSDVPNSH